MSILTMLYLDSITWRACICCGFAYAVNLKYMVFWTFLLNNIRVQFGLIVYMLTVLSLLCPDYESRNYSKFKIPFSFSVILLHYLFVFGEPMYLHLNDMHPNPYIYITIQQNILLSNHRQLYKGSLNRAREYLRLRTSCLKLLTFVITFKT